MDAFWPARAILEDPDTGEVRVDSVRSSGWYVRGNVYLVDRQTQPAVREYHDPLLAALTVLEPTRGADGALDDDYLWLGGDAGYIGDPGILVEPSFTMLSEFLQLAQDGTDNATIHAFAARYGLLGLEFTERAGLGPTDPIWGPRRPDQLVPYLGYTANPYINHEPLALWRRIARQLHAAMTVGSLLRGGTHASKEEWQRLADVVQFTGWRFDTPGPHRVPGFANDPTVVEGQRPMLALVLNAWLGLGMVQPRFVWDRFEPDPSVQPGLMSLFGGLVLQLVQALGGRQVFALCAYCGTLHQARHRPSATRASYCSDCRAQKRPQQLATARWARANPDKVREYKRAQRATKETMND